MKSVSSRRSWRSVPYARQSLRIGHESITCSGTHPKDRKSTRLNSSHLGISYAVFCLKKKKKIECKQCVHTPQHMTGYQRMTRAKGYNYDGNARTQTYYLSSIEKSR